MDALKMHRIVFVVFKSSVTMYVACQCEYMNPEKRRGQES